MDYAPDRASLIVFDWDGTLMDSEARIVASMQGAFRACGLDAPPAEAVREIIGLGLETAIARLLGDGDPERIAALATAYRERFLASDPTPMPLFEGVRELIEALHRRGRLLAVATGKGRAGLDKALTESGLGALFHATRCADESFSKPHPAMLLELMDELGAEAARTLMVGDTEYDLLMARNAGVPAVAVGYGTQALERLRAHEPVCAARSVAELADCLLRTGLRTSA